MKIPFFLSFYFFSFFIGFCITTVYRIFFYGIYSYRIQEFHIKTLLLAFGKGIRFDLSILASFLGIGFLLSSLQFANNSKVYRSIWRGISPIVLVILLFLSIADLIYYENGNKHLGYEAFAYLGFELLPLLGSAFSQNPIAFVGGFLALFFIMWGVQRVQYRFEYKHEPLVWWKSGLLTVGVFVFVVIGIRGGLQNSPIRTGDALVSKESTWNDLVLHPGFTVISDLKMTRVDRRHAMPITEAVALVRENIQYPDSEFLTEDYPLLRKLTPAQKSLPLPNVVIIVLEGWTGKYVIEGKNGNEVTPFFNKLRKKGVYFSRFFASGGRTTNGLLAMFGGIPDRPGLTAVRTPQILNRFSGLGNVARQLGYETLFVTGTDLSFNNKGSIMFHWGFENQIGKLHLDKKPNYKSGPWSYLDESTYRELYEQVQKYQKPFVAVLHTGTTHYPYKIPSEEFRLFDKSVQDADYLNVLYYADRALETFMKDMESTKGETIYVFVSDHSHHRFLNYYEDRHVPLLFYSPTRWKPSERNEISSQLDLMPTILGLFGRELYFSAMGRDLFRTQANSAYFAYGNVFGWIEGDFLYHQSVSGGQGETKTIKAPFIDIGLCYKDPLLCKRHANYTKAFLNLSDWSLNTNRLFPSSTELERIITPKN